MKIEKIDINKMDDISIWLKSLTDKVNELVDAHNLSVVEKDALDTNVTTIVAKIKDNELNMSTLKYNETKIDCIFDPNIEIDGEMLKNGVINTNKGW